LKSWHNGCANEPNSKCMEALESYLMDGPASVSAGISRSADAPHYKGWYVNATDGSANRAFIGFVEAKGYWAYLGRDEPCAADGWQLVVAAPSAWAQALAGDLNLPAVDRNRAPTKGVKAKGVVDFKWSAADEVVYKPQPEQLEMLIRRMAMYSRPGS
jgi:hypothetical protein